MSGLSEADLLTTESVAQEAFKCYCGEWRFRNALDILNDIRARVCRKLPFYGEVDGKKYCVLHYPSKEKTTHFEPVFQERTNEIAWDFRMVYFPNVLAYESNEFATKADFSHATFAERVDFKYCKFRAKFVFFDARFLDDAFFTFSKFFNQVNFNSVDFQRYGGFSGVEFHAESSPSFRRAKFKSASFGSVKYHPEANFEGSVFTDSAHFSRAEFFSKADFEDITLPEKKKAEFSSAIFHESANFRNVVFYETDFSRAKFGISEIAASKLAIFEGCQFTKSASFLNTEFRSAVSFSNASFQNVHFEEATFGDQANFLESSFSEDVFFNNSKFGFRDGRRTRSTHVVFDGATFGKDSRVFFDNTWFSWHTSFDYARFNGFVFFKGTAENPVFDRVFEKHAFWSLLKILNATFDRPEKVYFEAVRLRPSWFVNVLPEVRHFNFTNIDWSDEKGGFITIEGELRVIEKLTTHHSRRLLAIVFRQLADNAETNSRFEDASLFRRLSMQTEWLEKKNRFGKIITNLDLAADKLKTRFGERILGKDADKSEQSAEPVDAFSALRRSDGFFVHLLYRGTSYYGESWALASLVLLGMLLITFPVVYMRTQFQLCPKEKPVSISLAACESNDAQTKKNCQCTTGGLSFGEGIAHSLTTATLQNVDYRKPTTKKGETVIILEKIFAPLQLALLALALRRKFMR